MIIKEFERWINADRPKVWVKGKEDDRWDTMRVPCWNSSGLVYIVDDEQAELRKLQIDEPDTKFQWFNVQEWRNCNPSWDIDIEYRVKPKEWYEDENMVGKPIWVRDCTTDEWDLDIFVKYDPKHNFEFVGKSFMWKYAKPVKPEDLYQGVTND